MVGVLAVAVATLGVAGEAAAQQTINPSGGTGAADGLRIVIEPNTNVQIHRAGARQLYEPDGVVLAAGTTMTGNPRQAGSIPGATGWTTVAQTPATGAGTSADPFAVATTVQNAAGFTVTQTIRYVVPEPFFDLSVLVTPPGGNTSAVKIYHLTDTYLSGGDNGAAFWQPDTGVNPPPTTPTVLGVTKNVGGVDQYQVFIAGNRLWDRYYSANYYPQFEQVESGGDLGNDLDTNVSTDNGMGVQWNLGVLSSPVLVTYRLSFSTTSTPPVCGNGVIEGFETCDDGGTGDGDGCSALCQIESGWDCVGAPSTCTPQAVCGNGVVEGAEACDDGNLAAGDGCSATCTEELGWDCAGSPSVCAPVCGDGIVAGGEACDDGGTAAGDGCSATCTEESGWDCAGAPSVCVTVCGDGIVAGAEACDDGGTAAGDGCSATCTEESGWDCAGAPSVCVTVCGDGIVAGAEACDDGGTAAG
ncbi:MAG: DUF4215 domain-containing protein, partial [Myxococcales bacterium]|nr:DUF4215 domain-containing protein [Myxococcales bacterium]